MAKVIDSISEKLIGYTYEDFKRSTIIYNTKDDSVQYNLNEDIHGKKTICIENINGHDVFFPVDRMHDWSFERMIFNPQTKRLLLKFLGYYKDEIYNLEVYDVSNMILPLQYPWNSKDLDVSVLIVDDKTLIIEFLTGDVWRISGIKYVVYATGEYEKRNWNKRFYPGDLIE